MDLSITLVRSGSTNRRHSDVDRNDDHPIHPLRHPMWNWWRNSEAEEFASVQAGSCNLSRNLHHRISIGVYLPVNTEVLRDSISAHSVFFISSYLDSRCSVHNWMATVVYYLGFLQSAQ